MRCGVLKHSLPLAAALFAAYAVTAPGTAHANWNQKAQHYCTNWGSAGLYPDDDKALKANPLAKLTIPLRDGSKLEFPLLYLFKGYELDESPKEWAEIWSGFARACPGWPKPAWLQKLEQWKAQNAPKGDPRIAKRQARIKALLASADAKEAQAATERAKVMASDAYKKITGGREDWKAAAEAQKIFLEQIVSLKSTKYVIVGRVAQKLKEGVWIDGLAIAAKPQPNAPGTRTQPVRMFVQNPKSTWLRPNDNALIDGAYLLGIPTQQNPNVVFGPVVPSETKKAIAKAAKDLRTVTSNIKSGEARIKAMLRPIEKLEEEAKQLRLLATQLQSKNAAQR